MMLSPEGSAFTTRYGGISTVIHNKVYISLPYRIPAKDDPGLHEVTGIWDTGASMSAITFESLARLGLTLEQSTGVKQIQGVHGIEDRPTFIIGLYLPNNFGFNELEVTACGETIGGFGILIGMDVITQGDFSVTHANGQSVFSFRMPSVREVDYIQDIKKRDFKNLRFRPRPNKR